MTELPVLANGSRGVQLTLVAANSGQAPLRGSLQQYDTYYNQWQEIRSSVVGNGGTLSLDVPGGIPEGVPLKLIVTTDVGSFMHLDQMSYSEYASQVVPDGDVNNGQNSAFAGAVNLPLTPMPAEVGLDKGTNYVTLSVPNRVAAPMGVELSLPAVAAGDDGVSLRFGLDGGGNEDPAVVSLQAYQNGVWGEVGSSLVVGGGLVDIELLDMGFPLGTQLKVVASTSKGVALAVSNFDYATITKAVHTYMALSCDTDAAWNDGYRYGFNGQVKTDEIAGRGNHNTAMFWELDTRLGRRWNLDPVDQIGISNYAVNRNNPIVFSDPLGDAAKAKKKNGETQPEEIPEVEKKDKAPEWVLRKREKEATERNGQTFGGSGPYNVRQAGIMDIGRNDYNRQKAAWAEQGVAAYFYISATPLIAMTLVEAGVTINAAGEFLEMASNIKEAYDKNSAVSLGQVGVGSNGTLNPNEIHFMQSSIRNATGEFTVLGNAEALKSGTLNPEVLRMNVWKDANGKIWTLDHRRLAAFRLSGLQEAPIQWADPSRQMWKMTTTNGGTSIKLKLGNGQSTTVK